MKITRLALCVLLMTLPLMGQGQLDQQAWISITTRLATYFPAASASYKVQFPSAPMTALWADKNNLDSILSLNSVADVIPPWSPIWASSTDSVSERYGFVVEAIDPPPAKNANPRVKAAAEKNYQATHDALKKAIKDLQDELNAEKKNREDQGIPFPLKDRLEWWSANGGSLTVPLRKYQDAANEYGKTIDPNSPIFNAIDAYRAAQKAAAGNNLTPGVFPYKGSELALKTLIDAGKAADASNSCTGGWTFNKSASLQQSSSSSWSGSASYGPFISVGGNGAHSEDMLKEDGTYISILFCALGYIEIAPDGWYSSGLLDLLKNNQLKLQAASALNSRQLFGEGGWLSRIPVGVIVAYKPRITAKLSSTYTKTVVNTWNAGGGIGFGPLRLGGNGGGSSREQAKDNQDGSYTYPAPGDQPYIIAIVSKEVP
jgi:hypothetical protein